MMEFKIIKIPKDLHKALKSKSVIQECLLQELTEKLLRQGLEGLSNGS